MTKNNSTSYGATCINFRNSFSANNFTAEIIFVGFYSNILLRLTSRHNYDRQNKSAGYPLKVSSYVEGLFQTSEESYIDGLTRRTSKTSRFLPAATESTWHVVICSIFTRVMSDERSCLAAISEFKLPNPLFIPSSVQRS